MNVENGNHKTEGKTIWTIIPQHHQMLSNVWEWMKVRKYSAKKKKIKISENKKDL